MKKYLDSYIIEIDNLINKKNIKNIDEVIEKHLIKISFFQHERLIHLLVTLFYTLFFFISLALVMLSYYFLIIFAILFVFEIFYIRHYFFLENKVQYLYTQYDKLIKAKTNGN